MAYLSTANNEYAELGLDVECAIRHELSNVLWANGELVPSIRTLKDLVQHEDFASQSISVGKAGLLATLVSSCDTHDLSESADMLRVIALQRPVWRSQTTS